MLGMTFGDDAAAQAAADRINRIHDRVNGTLRHAAGRLSAGTPYSAHDPELLAWVQLTLLDTMPRAYELLVAPLTPAEKDASCVEARRGARLLGIPDHLVPAPYADVSSAVQLGSRRRSSSSSVPLVHSLETSSGPPAGCAIAITRVHGAPGNRSAVCPMQTSGSELVVDVEPH